MKIEQGKYYRTRNGHKARIYTTDGYGDYPIHGAVLMDNGWRLAMWASDGNSDIYKAQQDTFDLVSEWKDTPIVYWAAMPAWCDYVAMDADGVWGCYAGYPQINNYAYKWMAPGRINIPKEYHPVFTGDWKDSLVERNEK